MSNNYFKSCPALPVLYSSKTGLEHITLTQVLQPYLQFLSRRLVDHVPERGPPSGYAVADLMYINLDACA